MEVLQAIKQAEGSLGIVADRVSAMDGKLEDLVFRAQRIANAAKNGHRDGDTMFGYDLQAFRREVRTFSHELAALPNLIGGVERLAVACDAAVKPAQGLARACDKVSRSLRTLLDHALLAHQHIRQADHKIEAWYMAQDVEQMAQKGQTLPALAQRVVQIVGKDSP